MQPHTTTLLASQAQSLCNFARIYVDVRLPMQRPALHDSQWLAGRDRLPKPRRRLGINLQRATPGTACLRHSGGVKPASASDVRRYAREEFQAEVDYRRPDAEINLAKACMLIALEEEAAFEDDLLHTSSSELTWLKVLSDDVQQQNDLEDVELSLVNREIGTASSWSLSCLDSLADEVRTCFMAQHPASSGDHSASDSNRDLAPEDAALLDRQSSNSSASSSAGSKLDVSVPSDADSKASLELPNHVSTDGRITIDPVVRAMQQYPMQTVAAINTVLYDRHGYHRMLVHGNPRDAQLSTVLESGAGTPAALAVLYMEVARRLGSPMAARPLEGGRQCVIWPAHGGLRADGEHFVIDPYSQGAVYSQAEVAELFELEVQSKAGLRAASRREVLAAMLAAVRDAHWCRAVGCHPEPGLMTPIDLQTVATGKVQPMNGCDVSRALASAERRLFLLPESREARLEHALLLYFAGQHNDALQELKLYKKGITESEHERLDVVLARLAYLVYECNTW